MADGSEWQVQANGYYNVGDLVLGSVYYSGGNSTSSGAFRLYNGSSFIDTGTITRATSSSKTNDSSRDLIIGNIRKDDNADINAPFEGSLFGVWFTKEFTNSLDDGFFSRWIP